MINKIDSVALLRGALEQICHIADMDTTNGALVFEIAKVALTERAAIQPAGEVVVKVERSRVWIVNGVQSFMLAYEADTEKELNWYADKLRAALATPAPTGESVGVPEVKDAMLDICDDLIRDLEFDAAKQSGVHQCKKKISLYFAAKESA